MHTHFSTYRRPILFQGQPTASDASTDYPVTPPTPSTAKTSESTDDAVRGALQILNGLFTAGALKKDVYEQLSGAYNKSQNTSDGFKDKAQRFDSKRMGANDDVDEIESELNKSKKETERAMALVKKAEAGQSRLIQENGKLRQQLLSGERQTLESAPVLPGKATLQLRQQSLTEKKMSPGSSMQHKQPLQRPKSKLSNSITANPDPTPDTTEPEQTPQAGDTQTPCTPIQ